jgi:hypothetical protein
MQVEDAERLSRLEVEYARLMMLLVEAKLVKVMLTEPVEGNL